MSVQVHGLSEPLLADEASAIEQASIILLEASRDDAGKAVTQKVCNLYPVPCTLDPVP